MTFYDLISFAKLFSRISSGSMTMSDAEMEAAAEVLKQLGDSAPSWNPAQKELYKAMVDAAKESSRGQRNG